MRPVLRLLRGAVSALILVLLAIGFVPREAASRLVPLQKFLTRKLDGRATP